MAWLAGCTKVMVAVGVVPVAIILAAFLETPAIQHFDGSLAHEEFEKYNLTSATAEFGAAGHEGMGSGGMFDRIAFVYDLVNKVMSFGLDQYWRTSLVNDCLRLEKNDKVLDLATGTADVSLLAGTRLRDLGSSGQAVIGLDPSTEMLRHGVDKVGNRGMENTVRLVKGDAQNLTYVQDIDQAGNVQKPTAGLSSGSIDKISMSFGIRNVPNRVLAFKEMKRVLQDKERSRICILELSLPDGEKFLSKVAKTFITHVVPAIGRLFTGNSGAAEYQYLERSILKFPQPRDFARSMSREGLHVRSITSFAYGAVHLYAASPVAPDRVGS